MSMYVGEYQHGMLIQAAVLRVYMIRWVIVDVGVQTAAVL